MNFRPMQNADLAQVIAAEALLHESPWSPDSFRSSITSGHQLIVAENEGALVGYAVTSLVLDEAELLTMGIVQGEQRKGQGGLLLLHAIEQVRQKGATKMFLEVRSGNVAGHTLYLRHGFTEIGRRRGYYPAKTGREDALVMMRTIAADV